MNLEDLFNMPSTPSIADQRRAYIMERRQCEESGHRYAVVGSKSPTGLRCRRCLCTWAIGPKTEPTLP